MIIKSTLLLVCLAILAGCATSTLGSGNISIDASSAWDKQPEAFEALTQQVNKELVAHNEPGESSFGHYCPASNPSVF